jgi:endonuclease/exonuclease/phosphatase family metal-dependent hydrolase
MRDVDADIWILTETHDSISPGPEYAYVSSSGCDRIQAEGESWVTIWSRLPVIETSPTSDEIRTACAIVRTKSGGTLVVHGTVLPWLGSAWRTHESSAGTAFGAALDTQLADWQRLREEHPDAEHCVAGDMNQDLQDRHYYGSAINRSALQAAFARVKLTCVTAGTLDPVSKITGGAHAAIDHICLSDRLARGTSSVGAWPDRAAPDPKLSDHFGLWADVGVA